jgi:hypothetical protein
MDSARFIAADDWADQDILTRAEAKERLTGEIDAERGALATLSESDPDPRVQAEIASRTRRLTALRAAHEQM